MQKFIITNTEGANLYVVEARYFKEAVLEALQSLGNLAGADLAEANLRGADLAGANLAGANLAGANLTGANLRGADLAGADLEEADLARADLAGANLARADLARADLTGAYLRGANLAGANLIGAYLRGANLAGANLIGAYLEEADLAGANLTGADLTGAYLRGANLAGADLSFETVEIPADEAEVNNLTPTKAALLLNPSELESKIVLWAKEKGITSKDNAKNQFLKTVEEVGELASALAKNDLEEVKDSVGDIIVTLIILAEIKGFSATEALSNVYDIISKRTGKTVGGVFVKDE
jgi:NTP pyrophosphatase (non-canonical NTP hydrolase)